MKELTLCRGSNLSREMLRFSCTERLSSRAPCRARNVCLYFWTFSSHTRIFHLFRDVTIAGEGLQILTYARHLLPFNSKGRVPHLLWHGHPFIMVLSEDLRHSHLMLSVWQWSNRYLFSRLRSVAAGIRTSNLPLAGRTLQPTATSQWQLRMSAITVYIVNECTVSKWSMVSVRAGCVWNVIVLVLRDFSVVGVT